MNKMNVCSEILGFINVLDIDAIDKLPNSFINTIIENRNKTYNPTYESLADFFEDINTSKESKIVILYCYYKYLCENVQEKEAITQLFKENDITKNLINYKLNEDLFNNSSKKINCKKKELTIVVEKEKWYTRFFSYIKRVFMKKGT